MTTPKLGLDEIAESQSNKYATHNEALRGIDALLPGVAISVRHSPPGSPANGDVYIISDGSPTATGDWAGQDGDIAWYNGAWNFVTPEEGFTLYNQGADEEWRFDGTSWAAVAGSGVTLEDEGSTVTGGPHTTLNFTGSGVSVTNAGGGEATITISGGGGGSGIGSATGFKGASIYSSAGQSIPDSVFTVVNFESEEYDTNGYHVTGSPGDDTRLTVPETGYYLVSASVTFSAATADTRRTIRIYKNGTAVATDERDTPFVTDGVSAGVTTVLYLEANDYVQVFAYQNSGGAVTLRNAAANQYPRLHLAKLETTTGAQSFSGCQLTRETAQTLSDSTTTTILFDTVQFDTDNYSALNGSPDNAIVIPADGYYFCHLQARHANNASGRRILSITLNGTVYGSSEVAVNTAQGEGMQATYMGYMTTGTIVGASAFQSSGGNLDLLAGSVSQYPRLSVYRIATPGIVVSNEGAGSPTVDQTFSEIRIGAGLELEDLGSGVGRITVGETGTWTPTFEPASGSFTSVTYDPLTEGTYIRQGRKVWVRGRIRTDAITVGTASGNVSIGGLPFTPSDNSAVTLGIVSGWSTNPPVYSLAAASGTTCTLYIGSNYTQCQVSDMGTGANANDVILSATYETND